MEIMKRITLLALALGLGLSAQAQDITYALPNTVFTVKITVQQEQFFAGPYASYAKKFLNLNVQEEDAVTCSLLSAEILPRTEADQKALYNCEAENAALLSFSSQGLIALQNKADAPATAWRFPAPASARFEGSISSPEREETRITYKSIKTDDGDIQVPVEHKAKMAKSEEDKAAEAAETILTLRRERMNIVSGNTDASYSGEALGAAIKELDRQEEAYLTLFRGYSVKGIVEASFDVIPDAKQKHHRYLAFRLTDDGPVSDGVKGVPYYLELEPEEMAFPGEDEKKSKVKGNPIRYRIPVVCKVRFTRDGLLLAETRQPVFQLGKTAYFAQNK